MGLASISLTWLAANATALGEMTQNNGRYAGQGHSRSSISVPIEASAYMRFPISCVNVCLSVRTSVECRTLSPLPVMIPPPPLRPIFATW